MRRFPNLTLAILLAVFVGLAGFQGRQVQQIREAEALYRWLVSAADQWGRDGYLIPPEVEAEPNNYVDEEYFAEVAASLEPLLADEYATGRTDQVADTKLVNMVRSTETDESLDVSLWNAVRSDDLADARRAYEAFTAEDQLYTDVGDLALGDLYGEGRVTASLGNVFLGFRKMAANLLWLQTDTYFHSGEDHRILPTIQTVVALDPNFVDAFLIGAWHMAYNMSAKLEPTPESAKEYMPRYEAWVGPREILYYQGIELLKDGIEKNPRNYKLYFDLGFGIYEEKLKDHENAAKYLSEAIRYRHEPWVARTLYRVLQYAGRYEEAIDGWNNYLENYDPTNPNAPRFIRYAEALIAEREGREALERAREADAPDVRETAMTEMRDYFDKAREIWADVEQRFGDDPFGQSRLRVMKALELREEERYIEAIAYLQQARSEASEDDFQEISDLIIEIKQEAGEPLNLSERMQLIREEAAAEAREQRRQNLAQAGTGQAEPAERSSTPFLALIAMVGAVVVAAGYVASRRVARRS